MTGPAYEKIMRQAINDLNKGCPKSYLPSGLERFFVNFVSNIAGAIYLIIAIPVTVASLLGFLSFMFAGV